jgi:hypothetical protein
MVRELIDGRSGRDERTDDWWTSYLEKVQDAADQHREA